jgi:hypothetical protein
MPAILVIPQKSARSVQEAEGLQSSFPEQDVIEKAVADESS